MRLLHYLEIQNFKRFGDRQRIELDHPAVLIGPNNCGKTTAIQAIALWSQAVQTWYDSKGKAPPKERTSTSINRLNIVAVPVQRTRYFWHDTNVRRGNRDVPLVITVGLSHGNTVEPVTMRFRNQGDELIYCTPDEATLDRPELIAAAAGLGVELLYPMSGLETEEPILQPGRIDVLLGQGQTAQVLRNLCLLVHKEAPEDWDRIAALMERLFAVRLDRPQETTRGSINLFYRQDNAKEALDFTTWQGLDADAARLVWASGTGGIKLGDFAEEFFRRLADRLGHAMLLRKSELHRLVDFADPESIPDEVTEKLDLLTGLFATARPGEEA